MSGSRCDYVARGKLLALSTAAVSVVVLVTAGFAAKDWILEEWRIHELKTGMVQEQACAATRLGELRSVRAIPFLFRAFGEVGRRLDAPPDVEPEEDAVWYPLDERGVDLSSLNSDWALWTACLRSLHEIASETRPGVEQALLQALRDESVAVRAYSCDLLGSMKRPPKEVMSGLQEALQDSDRSVRRAAGHALKKIQVH